LADELAEQKVVWKVAKMADYLDFYLVVQKVVL